MFGELGARIVALNLFVEQSEAISVNARNSIRANDANPVSGAQQTRLDPRIERVIAIIEATPHQRLTITIMARIACLSASRFRHKFKSEVGITPTVYVQKVRMRIAADLLKDENVSVKEVRAAVGLGSDSYFAHLCKRVHGRPPSQLRSN
jgi:transcriptional regulator GlxA family with amidase domain